MCAKGVMKGESVEWGGEAEAGVEEGGRKLGWRKGGHDGGEGGWDGKGG
jgi:hypothetical protein